MPGRIDAGEAVAVMRAAGLEPLEPYPGANVAWNSRCVKNAHQVAPTFTSVRVGASGDAVTADASPPGNGDGRPAGSRPRRTCVPPASNRWSPTRGPG